MTSDDRLDDSIAALFEGNPQISQSMTTIRPFHLAVPDATPDWIRTRVAEYPWHEIPDDNGWAYGANLDYMKEFCAYWLEEYDWRKHESKINRLTHHMACIDGIDLHFIYEKGSGPALFLLIISHGWPGSVVKFLDIIRTCQK